MTELGWEEIAAALPKAAHARGPMSFVVESFPDVDVAIAWEFIVYCRDCSSTTQARELHKGKSIEAAHLVAANHCQSTRHSPILLIRSRQVYRAKETHEPAS